MIPRKIYYIWFGDRELPKFLDYSISSFRKLNPAFEIQIIKYTIDDLNNNADSDLQKFKQILFNEKSILHNICKGSFTYAKTNLKLDIEDPLSTHKIDQNNMVFVKDAYVRFLINEYGGIYVDCDCYCIREFDDIFLSQTGYIVKSDHYFMAGDKNSMTDDYIRLNRSYRDYHIVDNSNCIWGNLPIKQKFYDNTLTIDDCIQHYGKHHPNNEIPYFIHFISRTWRK